MHTRRPAFLFDLDGTLLDSRGDLADAANAARAALGLPPLSDEAVERHTGWGMAALLAGVVPEATPEMLVRAREVFIPYYQKHLLKRSPPYPRVEEMFEALAGHPLGLVTNKPAMFTVPIVEALGWNRHFGVVVSGDTTPQRKPAPEPLLHGLAALGVAPAEAIFVGDTPIDAETARNAGVRFIAVPWGRVAVGGVDAVAGVQTVAHLPDLARFRV